MEQQYIKTGEDKNFEYYRNDSEVLSGDGEEEIYEEILKKKEEFTVKINNKELKIKKRTMNRIMILSDSQPEEQILFSHYKTVEKNQSKDKIKTQAISNANKKSENKENININPVQPLVSYKKLDQPLSEKNNNSVAISINIPSISESKNDSNDSGNLMFKKTENSDNLLIVSLPPKAVKIKWFYLLLVLCGIINVIYFIYCCIRIKFLFNIFLIMIFGLLHVLTGFIGHNKINNKIYNDNKLFILTILSAVLPIVNIILILVNNATKAHIFFGLVINIISIVLAILCIVFTEQLKKEDNITKISQMEKLL